MLHIIPDGMTVEINLGCPNVHRYGISQKTLKAFTRHFTTIVKLPATDLIDEVANLAIMAGAHYLHCSNTLPTRRGGESGRLLREWNLPVVTRLSNRYPNIPIIAGGGIYSIDNVREYEEAGASKFSLSTAWFLPWRALKIISEHQVK